MRQSVDETTGEIRENEEEIVDENEKPYVGLDYETACELLRNLKSKEDFTKWEAGDIIYAITENVRKKEELKEILQSIALDTKSDIDTITQYRWVSSKFPPGKIREEYCDALSWSHYRACAAVDEPEKWLEKAATELLSVKQLTGEIAAVNENKKIELNGGCSRSGCDNNVSIISSERVSLQAYGQKFTFCSAACATNFLLNDLHVVKAELLNQPIPVESSKSILIKHPDTNLTIDSECWYKIRFDREIKHFQSKYGRRKGF